MTTLVAIWAVSALCVAFTIKLWDHSRDVRDFYREATSIRYHLLEPGPYTRHGDCKGSVIPVRSVVTSELLAGICPACGAQVSAQEAAMWRDPADMTKPPPTRR